MVNDDYVKKIIEFILSLFKSSKTLKPAETHKPVVKPTEPPKQGGALTRQELNDIHTDIISGKIKIEGYSQKGYDGFRESQGSNKSPDISPMIKRQGGSPGQPYCMYGQQELVDVLCKHLKIDRKKFALPESGSTQTVWQATQEKYKTQTPELMSLCIVQYNKEWKGHVECVKQIESIKDGVFNMLMFAFNTNINDAKLNRDGDGSGYVSRSLKKTQKIKGNIVDLKGFIDLYEIYLDTVKG